MSVFLTVHSTCQWHAGKPEVSVVVLHQYGTAFFTFCYRYSSRAETMLPSAASPPLVYLTNPITSA